MKWVARGTGTPKDKDDVNRRDVYECGFGLHDKTRFYFTVNQEIES
jgi:hypothetical protein